MRYSTRLESKDFRRDRRNVASSSRLRWPCLVTMKYGERAVKRKDILCCWAKNGWLQVNGCSTRVEAQHTIACSGKSCELIADIELNCRLQGQLEDAEVRDRFGAMPRAWTTWKDIPKPARSKFFTCCQVKDRANKCRSAQSGPSLLFHLHGPGHGSRALRSLARPA